MFPGPMNPMHAPPMGADKPMPMGQPMMSYPMFPPGGFPGPVSAGGMPNPMRPPVGNMPPGGMMPNMPPGMSGGMPGMTAMPMGGLPAMGGFSNISSMNMPMMQVYPQKLRVK